MNNRSLFNLGLGLLLMILIIAGFSISSYVDSIKVNKQTEFEINNREDYSKVHGGMYRLHVERADLMRNMLSTTNVEKLNTLKEGIFKNRKKIDVLHKECKHMDANTNIFTLQDESMHRFMKLEDKFLDLVDNDNKKMANRFFEEAVIPKKSKILNQIQDGIEYAREETKQLNNKVFADNKKSIQTRFLINLFTFLLTTILFYVLFKSHKGTSNKIYRQASTDSLTGLLNRESFLKSTKQHISENPTSNSLVIFLDIDFFKVINDSHGHKFGDTVLVQFGQKIKEVIGNDNVVSRFGGDEFAILIKNVNVKQAENLVKKLSTALQFNYKQDDNNVAISSSIGVAQYPKDGKKVEVLLNAADQAMYLAKSSGRKTFVFYSKQIRETELINDKNTQKLRSILSSENINENLYLVYQPLLSCSKSLDKTKECEALLRWKDDNGNNISPDSFIPLAEKSNLIYKVNTFVINEVCKQQKIWQEQDSIEDIRVNINLSGSKEAFKELLNTLKTNIEKLALNPRLFGIEITERTLFDVSEETITELELVRKMGMKISIDDFGTGYSSFGYLNKLPITTLKIDKSFIDNLTNNFYNQKIVDSIITLGHSLGLEIVAEGVETVQQLKYLKSHSCNSIQGYLFKKPLAVSGIDTYLHQSS